MILIIAIGLILGSLHDLYTVICSLGYSITAFVATIRTKCRSILPVANNCGNIHVRFSTFFILENVGKIKNVKKRDTNKKRFYI